MANTAVPAMKRLIGALAVLFSLAALGCSPPDITLGGGGGDASDPSGGAGGEPPAGDPFMTGKVVSVATTEPITENCVDEADPDGDGAVSSNDPPACDPSPATFGSVHLKGNRADQGGQTEIVVSVSKQTPVVREAGGGYEPVDFDDVAKGDMVTVWIGGEVMESYPLQAGADFLLVE